jgi:Ethanolamine utilization protein EutJ (predicted chaperonin)
LNVVTANVQMQGTTGTLKVEILKNGQVVQSAETNTANNALSLTYSP